MAQKAGIMTNKLLDFMKKGWEAERLLLQYNNLD